ncbi:MAG TPA: S8 family serine peptidase [Vicinamibacterales bacterium]|nr:S8 family serine peptidase [Vicinamibacterales bacterium]
MYAVQKQEPVEQAKVTQPSDELRIAVTFKRLVDRLGPTKMAARMSTAAAPSFRPDPVEMDRAIAELHRRGFQLTSRGQLTVSVRGSRALFEKTFGTKLAAFHVRPTEQAAAHAFYFPPDGAPWKPDPLVMELIDDAYIQWPHIYMAKKAKPKAPSATPPKVKYFCLKMPKDVPELLRAADVHAKGTTGKGVTVAMVDSGFAHSHPFFVKNKFHSTVDLAARVKSASTDGNGHGTGESTNIFAVAPGATFIGIKVDNDDPNEQGATILEGFQQALQHKPRVISISLGYDLVQTDPATGQRVSETPLAKLPNNLVALEAEIQAAVAAGTIVVLSAGNGHVSFPGMMPDVIAAGGVYVDESGKPQASDYSSAFLSRIYAGRHVPDFCGLVGLLPNADYITLPIPSGCEIDIDNSHHDGTRATDGWGVFSGTSAAAPQLAGVCALLLEKNPGLTPGDIKAILRRTARDVTVGHANPDSNEGHGLPASTGDDGATGAGLVDAFAAWQQA